MDRTHRVIAGFLVIGAMVAVPYLTGALYVPPPPPPPPPALEAPEQVVEHLAINSGDNMDSILLRAGLDATTRQEILAAFNDAYDVRKVRAGKEFLLTRWKDSGEVTSLEYVVDPDHEVTVFRSAGLTTAELAEIPSTLEEATMCGTLESSLIGAMDKAGERDVLAYMMAEVLSYDIDFYRDPQPGDDFCILFEKKIYENGNPSTYGKVLAASYNNHGTVSSTFWFTNADGKSAYYGPNGESHKSAFLRSPLTYDARISSHFNPRRLHPVLHTVRAHNGTDYAAPTGTPVHAVADGKITHASMSGGSGNLVTIRHADGYETQYLHLSRILVRVGQSVDQGQTVGLVGSTGLATGPHLDLRIRKNGSYLNWEKMRSPKVVALDASQKKTFTLERDRMMDLMNTRQRDVRQATELATIDVYLDQQGN